MIQVDKVTKCFGKHKALDEISMHVRRGTVYGLVGSNGAGKTTVINHITGVLRPMSGSVTIDGISVFENEAAKCKMVSIADDWFFFGTFNIKEMAKFYSEMYPTWSKERFEELRSVFNFDEKRQIKNFSKGMKRQVAFWLALSAMPEVLVLDEPLDGLDPVMRKQVISACLSDVKSRGMTMLVSSHNLRELEDICDWVGIIHSGKMILEKELSDLRGNVHKYQLIPDAEKAEIIKNDTNVLHVSNVGSVWTVIVRGDAKEYDAKFSAVSPVLCERISLTLEEVFMYELGGVGYEIENIVV